MSLLKRTRKSTAKVSPSTSTFDEENSDDDKLSLTHASWLLQKASRLFANRKLALLLISHILATLVIFGHYGMTKYFVRNESLPMDEMNRTLKIIAPTIAYGTKHMIHFQLCMLPLTMCRYSIAHLSQTTLFRFIPFEDFAVYHIWVGYALMAFVILAFLAFMVYYSIACASGEASFCQGFSSEIMMTGYILFGLFMTVGISSYYRFQIRYKWFYNIHQLVFVAFFFAIIHTIDRIQRSQGGRSQVYVWISASLIWYISDRATLYTKGRHVTTIEGYQAINSRKQVDMDNNRVQDNGVIVLKLKKPKFFHFVAGHHAKLRIVDIDNSWHPFTIASSPDSELLEFYIKVNGSGTWTFNLLSLIRQRHSNMGESEKIRVEVMGPSGTPIPYSNEYSDALLIGSGTGFVPSLSILQQHIEKCLKLDPASYKAQKEKEQKKLEGLVKTEVNFDSDRFVGSVRMASSQEREEKAQAAKQEVYKHLTTFIGFIIGFVTLALTLSWNNLPYEVSSNFAYVLIAGTALFEGLYLILILTKQEIPSMGFFADAFALLIAMVGNWYWMIYKDMNKLAFGDMFFYSVFMLFILCRFWYEICQEIHMNPLLATSQTRTDNVYDTVTFVWIERSIDVVDEILPLFIELWSKLDTAWGTELANETLKFRIYCTDRNREACEELLEKAQNSRLKSMYGNIFAFSRPSFPSMFERHSLDLNSTRDISSTIVAFCGSSGVGSMIQDAYVMNKIWKASIGLLGHHAELQVHSYGGLFATKKKEISKVSSSRHPIADMRQSIQVAWNIGWESSYAKQVISDEFSPPTPSNQIEYGNSSRRISTPALDTIRSRKRDIENKYCSQEDSRRSLHSNSTQDDKKRMERQNTMKLLAGRASSRKSALSALSNSGHSSTRIEDIFSSNFTKRYIIEEKIGGDEFVGIRKVTLRASKTSFAAKIYPRARMTKKEDTELQREILFMRELQHEHIIVLHDVFNETEMCGFVMDLATGGDVFDRLMNTTSYSELDARTSILSLLSAIHHCHERRIAHRDIKPENLLIVQDVFQNKEIVKLADFGFASKTKNESCLITQCGSPLYVSPEILHGTPYGTKTDLWSIGVMSYILLCGYPPFVGDNSRDLFRVIKRGKFAFSERYWEAITSEAKQFISSLLVSDPKERFDTSQALHHPWMTMKPDTFTDLAASLQKLKLFNAKRKLRQAVFSLIATNKLTSLGLRFNSANAEDTADNISTDAASRPTRSAFSSVTMDTSPTNSSRSLQTEQSLEEFLGGNNETMHISPKYTSGSRSQNEPSVEESQEDREIRRNVTPANSSSSLQTDQGLEEPQLEQFVDHPTNHINKVNDDSKVQEGQNRTQMIRSKIAHLINGVKSSRKREEGTTLEETTSHLKQTDISQFIDEVKIRSTSQQEGKMMKSVTEEDNLGDEENKTAVKELVASQTSLHAKQHADKPSFQNEKEKNISKVIENTETRSRQNYFEYFGGRR